MDERHVASEEVREFHIGDILSVTNGRVLSPRLLEGVHDILRYMVGEQVYSHQVWRTIQECRPVLETQYPDLKEVNAPRGRLEAEQYQTWLGEVVVRYGETRPVLTVHPFNHKSIDPVEELSDMVGPENVITIELPKSE